MLTTTTANDEHPISETDGTVLLYVRSRVYMRKDEGTHIIEIADSTHIIRRYSGQRAKLVLDGTTTLLIIEFGLKSPYTFSFREDEGPCWLHRGDSDLRPVRLSPESSIVVRRIAALLAQHEISS